MSKKSANQSGQLSPENYIRKKSRNLPIKECYINKDWRKSRFCNIIIVRQHANSNVSFCIYIVDLGCLGVKETLYQFNMPTEIFEDFLREGLSDKMVLIKISYKLAHNIIYAGIEYAESYGFSPCKDYTSITGYFLEEDTNAIPLIKIACGGKDGNPLYVNTGTDSTAREKQVLAQLEKTAGEGNYRFIAKDDVHNEFTNDYYEEEEDEKEDEWTPHNEEHEKIKKELEAMSLEDKKNLFLKMNAKEDTKTPFSKDSTFRHFLLNNMLAFELTSTDEVDEQLNVFKVKFNREFISIDTLPNNLFAGIENVGKPIAYSFLKALHAIIKYKKPKKAIAEFKVLAGETPVSDYIEWYYIKLKNDKELDQKLIHYYQKYPDYFLFKIEYCAQALSKEKDSDLKIFEDLLLDHKQDLTKFEADCYFIAYAILLLENVNTKLPVVLAFEKFINELSFFNDLTMFKLAALILIAKTKKINELINQ